MKYTIEKYTTLVLRLQVYHEEFLLFHFDTEFDKNFYQIKKLNIDYQYEKSNYSKEDNDYYATTKCEKLKWDDKLLKISDEKVTLNQLPQLGLKIVKQFMEDLEKSNILIGTSNLENLGQFNEVVKNYDLTKFDPHLKYSYNVNFPDESPKYYVVEYEMFLESDKIKVKNAYIKSLNTQTGLFGGKSSLMYKASDWEIAESKMDDIIEYELDEL